MRRRMTQSGRHFGAIGRQHPHGDADAGGGYSGNPQQFRRRNRPHSSEAIVTEATSEQITVTVSVPSNVLSPNGRGVWQQRARAAKHAREEAYYAALAVLGSNWQPWAGRVSLLIRWCAKGRIPDLDNAAARLKHAIDGIVAAGLMRDDDQITGIRIERGPLDGHPHIELVFERD